MMVEVYGLTIDAALMARIVALGIFLIVAIRVVMLERKLKHIEQLTQNNFSDLQIKLANAIGVAEDSVTRDDRRSRTR